MRKFIKDYTVILIMIAIWAMAIMFGCKTQCPPASVVIHDSIHERIVRHDSIIYRTLPPVVMPSQILECDSDGFVKAFLKTFKKDGFKITEEVKNNKLEVTCQADSLMLVLKGLYVEKNTWIEHTKTSVLKPEIQYREHSDRKYLWIWFVITVLAMALWVYSKIKPI